MSIQSSHRLAIEHSHLTNVGRDQHNNNVQGDLIQYFNREERQEWTIWDDYHNVPTCKIRLKRRVGETLVQRLDQKKWRHLNAYRKISIASISDEDKDSEFLYVLYSGPDAFKAFQQDFEQFSCIKDINYVQLYGYNRGTTLPALVFHDAPVPFSHIFEQHQFSPLLNIYIEHQVGMPEIASSFVDFRELWINPGTGQVFRGPFVKWSQNLQYFVYGLGSNLTSNNPPLSLQTYSDSTAVFNYLIQTLTTYNILQGINWSGRGTSESIANENIASALSSLPGTIYNRAHQEIITRCPRDRKEWYYRLWHQHNMSDAMWESRVHMGNGTVRFTVLPSDIQDLQNQKLWLCYDLSKEWEKFAESWLSQAHSVFSQLGICENEWEEYTILGSFWLILECQNGHPLQNNRNIPANKPLYLFILPIPRPIDSETIWSSWVMRSKYFWSFDSYGHKEMAEHLQWDYTAYDAIQQLCVSKGFDPKTLSLTQSLEFPILEIVGDKQRFEEVQDAALLSETTSFPSPVIEAHASTQSGIDSGDSPATLIHNGSHMAKDFRYQISTDSSLTRASKQWSIEKRMKNALTKVFKMPKKS
uniref:Uncharacterized protein n=1 Tax=Moniliophthora roreri TaxID=221103 RepID=A0A0W0FIC3_MONRR